MMKDLPEFNKKGDLPSGIHQATIDEAIERFGNSMPLRRVMARRLQKIYALAVKTGHLARFIVFGSFITNKPAPGDVDVFLLMEDSFDVTQFSGEVALIFDHVAMQNYEGATAIPVMGWIPKIYIW